MPYDPTTGGYTNNPAIGPETREQWIANVASSMVIEFANADGTRATSPLMDATLWQRAGIPMPPQEYIGVAINGGVAPPIVWQSMSAMATYLANNPQVAAQVGLTPPPSVSDPRSVASDADRDRRAAAEAQAQADKAAGERQAAADKAAGERNAASNTAQVETANISAGASRYAADKSAEVAAADRAEDARQFDKDLLERQRQFDLNIQEDRRQFNATMVKDLFAMGIELARRPVDWIAYQYYMANLSIPMTALNAGSVAQLLGAVPPTGPSEVGPMTGGPGALDGDTQLAMAAGVQPELVSLEQAIAQNPGGGGAVQSETLQTLTAASSVGQWAQALGGMAALEGKLNQERLVGLPEMLGDSAAGLRDLLMQYQAKQPVQPPAPPQPAAGAQQTPFLTPATTPSTTLPQVPGVRTPQPEPMTTLPAVPSPAQTNVNDGNTSGQNTGVYVGQTATPPPAQTTSAFGAPMAATGTGAQNPQGEAMIAAIAQELGMSVDQVRQLVPVNLLAGGYSKETIMNSPALQALRNQTVISGMRTAPAEGEKFATIQAFGVPLGIRSGQDINLSAFAKSSQSGQEMIQGALEAAGQYWPDVQKAMLKASPATNYQQGAFGKRRLWGS